MCQCRLPIRALNEAERGGNRRVPQAVALTRSFAIQLDRLWIDLSSIFRVVVARSTVQLIIVNNGRSMGAMLMVAENRSSSDSPRYSE